jgi:hypothetical protein
LSESRIPDIGASVPLRDRFLGCLLGCADGDALGAPYCGAAVGQAGDGTTMRTAALGVFFHRNPERLPEVVAAIFRITHQDPRSIAGGVAVAKAAQILADTPDINPTSFCLDIAEAIRLSWRPCGSCCGIRIPEPVQWATPSGWVEMSIRWGRLSAPWPESGWALRLSQDIFGKPFSRRNGFRGWSCDITP